MVSRADSSCCCIIVFIHWFRLVHKGARCFFPCVYMRAYSHAIDKALIYVMSSVGFIWRTKITYISHIQRITNVAKPRFIVSWLSSTLWILHSGQMRDWISLYFIVELSWEENFAVSRIFTKSFLPVVVVGFQRRCFCMRRTGMRSQFVKP